MWSLKITCIIAIIPVILGDDYHTFSNSSKINDEYHRNKRQSECGRNKWQCRDGSCIDFDRKCDGIANCPDDSDETHAICRNTPCQNNLFRCTYGACVDGTAPCNGIQDCVDNSDELTPKCRNEIRRFGGQFKCDDGQLIPVTGFCDGVPDCADHSDETVATCESNSCPSYLFQCAYGACVDKGSDCNGKQDCADNSDESEALCNKTSTLPTNMNIEPRTTSTPSPGFGECILPPHPDNGRYEIVGDPSAEPGKKYTTAALKVVCDPGFAVDGDATRICFNGAGFEDLPKCSRYCILQPHRSVDYHCVTSAGSSLTTRPCNEREFPGTKVVPKCREPNYYGTVSNMHCKEDGTWSHIAKCTPDCGKITPDGLQYVIDGRRAKHGELPWHAGIYRKNAQPYMQICGGSLITTTNVISAAHCFWEDADGKQPAEMYAVGLGKVYRPWEDDQDKDSQRSNVSEIHIPQEFRGTLTILQSDIAILVLETEIVYQTFIRPVCVDFDKNLNSRQLRDGNLGKVAGWGLTSADGNPAQVLQVVELPFVNYKQCFDESPREFQPYINIDKICAGFKNGTTLCKGDSGGGLAFPELEKGYQKYYLRGIVSGAPRSSQQCDPLARITFTSIFIHREFIQDHVNLND